MARHVRARVRKAQRKATLGQFREYRRSAQRSFENMMHELCPPKPNELDSATSTCAGGEHAQSRPRARAAASRARGAHTSCFCAVPPTTIFKSTSGSGFFKLGFG